MFSSVQLLQIRATNREEEMHNFPYNSMPLIFLRHLWQIWSDFNNSFTCAFGDKWWKTRQQMLPFHLKSVVTLPCKIWMVNSATPSSCLIWKWWIYISPNFNLILRSCVFYRFKFHIQNISACSCTCHWLMGGVNNTPYNTAPNIQHPLAQNNTITSNNASSTQNQQLMKLCESQQAVTRWHIQTTYTRRLRCFQSNHILNY